MEVKMVYCQKCGTKNEEDAEYCSNCGADLQADKPRRRRRMDGRREKNVLDSLMEERL